MRRIAVINQKGGVGKTTTAVNLGAALARAERRVVLVDLDPQANLSLHLDLRAGPGEPSIYSILVGGGSFAESLRPTRTSGLALVPANIDLSGAELELANAIGREMILRDALDLWEREHRAAHGRAPADYVLVDCPPSLGLLSINALVAAPEVVVALQTEFFALQGISKLMEVLQLLRRRLNPRLEIAGILPCMYDARLRLAREVLAEIRTYFPGQVFARPIGKNVKLAESPSYGQTIFEYAPESPGAHDYAALAREVIAQETRDPELSVLGPPAETDPAAERLQGSQRLRKVDLQPAAPPGGEVAPSALRPARNLPGASVPPAPDRAAPSAEARGDLAPGGSAFRGRPEELPLLPDDAQLL